MTSPFSPYEPPRADELSQSVGDRDPGGPRRATLWQRFAAAILDSLVGVALLVPVQYKLGRFDGFPKVHTPSFGENALWTAISFLAFVAAHGYWLHKSGQTIGKRALGIHMVDAKTGAPASFVNLVFVRYLPVTLVVLVPKVGVFLVLVDDLLIFRRNRRCFHDILAGTIVTQKE